MKLILTWCFFIAAVALEVNGDADPCSNENCLRENGCACASPISPLPLDLTPQFVTFTFDDAATADIYDRFYEPILFNRINPDGKPISATFYVPHSYSDYERVNFLYNKGFDIAVNSISKSDLISYWSEADETRLVDEFFGQRTIISTFANISIDDIIGARTPHFEINGDITYQAYGSSEIAFDSSWTTLANNPLFPYSLDFLSTQQCLIGKCPKESHPGVWVMPINNFMGNDGINCNVLQSCSVNGTEDDYLNWLKQQFHKTYEGSRAPLSFLVNSGWFAENNSSLNGYQAFLDYLETLDDVWIVSHSEVLKWAKNPVPLGEYATDPPARYWYCKAPSSCSLQFETETRYMRSCAPCPSIYPWVGNPLGETLK